MVSVLIIVPPVARILNIYRVDYCEIMPLSALYIATVLQRDGYNCKVYWPDYDYSSKKNVWDEITEVVKSYSPNYIGLDFTTEQYNSAEKTAKIIKSIKGNIKIIAGGHHPTVLSEETLREIPYLDVVIKGEAEYSMLEVINSMEEGKSLEKVKGISYRKNESISSTSPRPPIRNLDKLPFPDRRLILGVGDKFNRLAQPIVGHRGCSYKCKMCAKDVNRSELRYRSPKNVVKEISSLYYRNSVFEFGFFDPTFTTNVNWVKEVCRLIKKEGLNISWRCTTRVDEVELELIKKMKEVGCVRIFLGAESGSNEILKFLNKGIKVSDIIKAQKIIKNGGGIHLRLAFLISSNFESEESLKLTQRLISKLQYDSGIIGFLFPYPGTKIWRILRSNNNINEKNKYNEFELSKLLKWICTKLGKEYLEEKCTKFKNIMKKKNKRVTINKIISEIRRILPGFKNLSLINLVIKRTVRLVKKIYYVRFSAKL